MRPHIVFVLVLLCAPALHAQMFNTVRGVVHDPSHRPVAGAAVTVKARTSDWTQKTETSDNGEFTFSAVPIGDYSVTVTKTGFAAASQDITVVSGTSPILHFPLELATVNETATVTAQVGVENVDSATPATLVSREDVARTPGADRTNSLSIITDFVPGAYYTHDQLHVRGGHQVTWLLDGVPIPNTNIASNVGPQFDPKDIDYLEADRGSYDAEYGDRTYGVFNVIPRTGFERNNEAEFISSAGNFYQTNDQFNFGSHTDRFAYYASVNGNRSNLGLQSPVGQITHDAENGYGGFASLIFNADAKDQFRFVTSLRRDYYQIPTAPGVIDEDPNSPEVITLSPYPPGTFQSDAQREADAFVNFSWVRTFNAGMLLTVSPFYHYNSADYAGNPNDYPLSTTDDRASTYAGGQATFAMNFARSNTEVGFYGFAQHDNQLFGVLFNDGSSTNFSDREPANGALEEEFLEQKFKVTRWFTVMAGVRESHFSAAIVENATSPRFGASLEIPRLHWVLHAFYGHYYQAPPLITASGPLLDFVTSQDLGFIPLRGERDEEHQFGITIPFRGWSLDADNFETRAKNFFDHNNVGNSDIFFPLTIDGALIQGWELTLRSPRLWNRGGVHLAYSNQLAQGRGAITGGLTDFSPPADYFPLDHDQRNTLNLGGDMNLLWHVFAATNVYYGSGFVNGIAPPGPAYLSGHTTFDLSVGKDFGERFTLTLNGLNVANRHLLIDNSLTFGGYHYNDPREMYVELRYRFHY